MYLDVTSDAAFRAMDRNKDGYITKGELKLAKKKMSMKEVDQVNFWTRAVTWAGGTWARAPLL